ncbi:MAG: hypothetical protein WAV90_19195 [Gordonia amarae]
MLATMGHNGYANVHTYHAAVAIDNTRDFYFGARARHVARALAGDVAGAAEGLRSDAVSSGVLPAHVDVAAVDWAQLVESAADESRA